MYWEAQLIFVTGSISYYISLHKILCILRVYKYNIIPFKLFVSTTLLFSENKEKKRWRLPYLFVIVLNCAVVSRRRTALSYVSNFIQK